jgi:hypothetical protein
MPRLTKRDVDAIDPATASNGSIVWDGELKGFGVRVFSTGSKKFILQYRTRLGQQRRLTLGAYGPLTVERAREMATVHLGRVAEGGDPAKERKDRKAAPTVAELCDVYLVAAEQGLVLGRRGTSKKASTLYTARSFANRTFTKVSRTRSREVGSTLTGMKIC